MRLHHPRKLKYGTSICINPFKCSFQARNKLCVSRALPFKCFHISVNSISSVNSLIIKKKNLKQ